MRWKTLTWFTVAVVTASAVHITVDNDLFVTNSITDELNVGIIPTRRPYSTEMAATDLYIAGTTTPIIDFTEITLSSIDTTPPSTTSPAVTTSAFVPTTSVNDVQTEQTTVKESDENTDEIATHKPEAVIPGTTTTTQITIVPTDQVGRSSEAVGEPGPAEGTNQEYIVLTSRGPVQGYPWRNNSEIIAYIDIPYGSFEGCFRDPTPPARWENMHKVREHNKRCPQIQGDNYTGALDCLTLSIFAPPEAVNASVLVHIHDSNFSRGSGDPAIYGPEYIVPKGTILVLPNYRLGPLGFLCLRNAIAPGNAGLKDLTLALRWIRQNIALFGGDPANVAVSGEGTSGALVGYLALSPSSRGYINKVITESGSVLSHWALNREPSVIANLLVDTVREMASSNISMEAVDPEIIVRAARLMYFTPCIEQNENPFLESTPWALLHDRPINVTFMMGSASHAGSIEATFVNDQAIDVMNNNFGFYLPNDLRFDDQNVRAVVGNRIRRQYFGNSSITLAHFEEMTMLFTDCRYLGPSIRTARALLNAGANVFFYEFAFIGKLNREIDSLNRTWNGTTRGDVIGYLFSQDGVVPAEGTNEKRMVDLMVDLWISFIKTGRPTADNVTWDQLNTTIADNEQWLYIGQEVEMRTGLHVNRLPLWTSIYQDHFIEHSLAQQNLPKVFFMVPFIVFAWFWKPTQ